MKDKVIQKKNAVWLVILSTVICGLGVGILLRLGAREQVLRLLDWIGSVGGWGPLIFIGVETLVVLFLVPGILFTLGAGFLFGSGLGTVCVVAGHTIGGVLAFSAARTLLRKQVAGLLQKHPALADLDRRITEEGWKIIMLTRKAQKRLYTGDNQ